MDPDSDAAEPSEPEDDEHPELDEDDAREGGGSEGQLRSGRPKYEDIK
jgi:hypothetical protein